MTYWALWSWQTRRTRRTRWARRTGTVQMIRQTGQITRVTVKITMLTGRQITSWPKKTLMPRRLLRMLY